MRISPSRPGSKRLRAALRGLFMDGYIGFYYVDSDRIVIVRVIDSRMDIEQEFSK
jgi:plasmid stabilization system protein ParE